MATGFYRNLLGKKGTTLVLDALSPQKQGADELSRNRQSTRAEPRTKLESQRVSCCARA